VWLEMHSVESPDWTALVTCKASATASLRKAIAQCKYLPCWSFWTLFSKLLLSLGGSKSS